MIIIVNVSEEYYEKIKDAACFGKELLENEGFIHASTCEQFPLIIPRLEKKGGSFMVLYIDTDKLSFQRLSFFNLFCNLSNGFT